jgi:hypothetical protein
MVLGEPDTIEADPVGLLHLVEHVTIQAWILVRLVAEHHVE